MPLAVYKAQAAPCAGLEVGLPRTRPQSTMSKRHADATHIQLPGLIDPHDLSTDRQFAMNLARGLMVLRAFTAHAPLLGNRELSDRTGLPKPTISRLTYTLALMGYLDRDKSSQKYRLGPGILSFAYPYLAGLPVRHVARPLMEQLAQQTGCNVNLGVRDRGDVVYVDAVRADRADMYRPDVGGMSPLLSSSSGRALILGSPPAEQAAILNFLRLADRGVYERYEPIFVEDRRRFSQWGYCMSCGDWKPDLHAIAVPINMPDGAPLMAMNCTLAAAEAPREVLAQEIAPLLKQTAAALEAAMRAQT